MKDIIWKSPHFKKGFKDAVPIAVSLFVFGAIFGMLALKADLLSWEAVAMSLFVFAGSAQFTALSMIDEQLSIYSIILATFLLNSRHLLMGLSVAPYYRNFTKPFVHIAAFFMTDEQYAIVLNEFRTAKVTKRYILAVSLSIYFGWVLGTGFGTLAGGLMPDPDSIGLGFSFTAMFLALVYNQLLTSYRIIVFIICGVLSVCLSFLIANGIHLLVAGVLAFLFGYFSSSKEEKELEEATLNDGN